MTTSLAAAVLLKGGVHPQQWVWSGLRISVAAILAATIASSSGDKRLVPWGIGVMGVLLAWMVFQLVPLPATVVERVTPQTLARGRRSAGGDKSSSISMVILIRGAFRHVRAID